MAALRFSFAGRLLALFLVAGALSPALAQRYEWIDEQGTVRRSDAPPEGTFRELRIVESPASMTALERRTLEIINQEARASHSASGTFEPPGSPVHPFEPAQEAPSVADASPASENVRDPCLLSWDPRCHEKHAADYDPRWGYAPSTSRTGRDR
jgi:hypothetical protein